MPITNVQNLSSSDANFKIYPNPASDFLMLEFNENVELNFVTILNNSGELILSKSVKESGDSIDIRELSAGIYLIRLNGEAVKFVKY